MCKDGLKTLVYHKIDHFCQWGTPLIWKSIIIGLIFLKNIKYSVLLQWQEQALGLKEGYKVPKPLILVNQKPMVVEATCHLPIGQNYIYICRTEHIKEDRIDDNIKQYFRNLNLSISII